MRNNIIIGYSGHAFVVIDALLSSPINKIFTGYCENLENDANPFDLKFLGKEKQLTLDCNNWFVGIGDNSIREKVIGKFSTDHLLTIAHPSSTLSLNVEVGKGTFLSARSTINALAKIGLGCIINSGAIVEHECHIGDFAHIAPGAVLAGNVTVGKRSFIGANATVIQGISIGNDVIVGAGAVIINDIPDNCTVVGNPGRIIK